MLLDAVWRLFEAHLFDLPSTDELFNPYRDRHPELDRPDAPATRRSNLRNYLACYEAPPKLFLLAEAPGPWGCRFSGVPITSEAQLLDPAFPIDGQPTGTAEAPHTEYSANIHWDLLQPYFPHFFTWNTVPLHPHDVGEPLTIRTPRVSEVTGYAELVTGLVDVLRPQRVLAIGRKAELALGRMGVDCTYVRHPSHGGANKFRAGVEAALRDAGLDRLLAS